MRDIFARARVLEEVPAAREVDGGLLQNAQGARMSREIEFLASIAEIIGPHSPLTPGERDVTRAISEPGRPCRKRSLRGAILRARARGRRYARESRARVGRPYEGWRIARLRTRARVEG